MGNKGATQPHSHPTVVVTCLPHGSPQGAVDPVSVCPAVVTVGPLSAPRCPREQTQKRAMPLRPPCCLPTPRGCRLRPAAVAVAAVESAVLLAALYLFCRSFVFCLFPLSFTYLDYLLFSDSILSPIWDHLCLLNLSSAVVGFTVRVPSDALSAFGGHGPSVRGIRPHGRSLPRGRV